MSYSIKVNLIPGLPHQPYDGGVGAYIGVVAHATAVYGDSAEAERNYETGHWQDAFVHFFVDDTGILQVADYNYICYGAGHSANHLGYVQVELCQTYDANKFNTAYNAYVWLLAWLLKRRNLQVINGQTLMSHAQVSAKWHETTHTDPIAYLNSHGKSWDDLVRDVTAQYQLMSSPQVLYRVRLSWDDAKSQLGAFENLANAKNLAAAHPGYKVFDEAGKVVFDPAKPQPTPVEPWVPPQPTEPIMGKSTVDAASMAGWLQTVNSTTGVGGVPITEFCQLYLKEGNAEGVRGDIAFCQAVHETNYFRFGGQVLPSQNNYGGLGVVDSQTRGLSFKFPLEGIRAHIQHLKAYGSTLPLNLACVDPRFNLVKRGCAPSWQDLAGHWAVPGYDSKQYKDIQSAYAAGATYGQKIMALFYQLEDYVIKHPPTPEPPENPDPGETPPAQDSNGFFIALIKAIIDFLKQFFGIK